MWPPKSDSQLEMGYMTPKQSDLSVDNTRTRRNSWPVFVTRVGNTTRTKAVNTTITMATRSPRVLASRNAIASEQEPSAVDPLPVSSNSSLWETSNSSSYYKQYSEYSMNTNFDVNNLGLQKSAIFGEQQSREGCVDGVCIQSSHHHNGIIC